MKKFIVNPNADDNGTSYQGCIDISYAELVALFGKPNKSYCDKIKAKWIITSVDGKVVATIYDYKSGVSARRNRDWHIGGDDKNAVKLVEEACATNTTNPLVDFLKS